METEELVEKYGRKVLLEVYKGSKGNDCIYYHPTKISKNMGVSLDNITPVLDSFLSEGLIISKLNLDGVGYRINSEKIGEIEEILKGEV